MNQPLMTSIEAMRWINDGIANFKQRLKGTKVRRCHNSVNDFAKT
jgi:hypothetical protein